MALQYTNVAFYRFVELPAFRELRSTFRERASELGLRGTIILSPEGINGFVAGEDAQVGRFREFLTGFDELKGLDFKVSYSSRLPFGKLKIKLKKEIIPFGRPEIRPSKRTGSRLAGGELKNWLENGKDVVILDTRNDYEIQVGAFENAVDLGLKHFRDFPERFREYAERNVERLRETPVVMYCTGGIRCEKATAYALELGLEQVYQLEGGVLRYFEECGDAFYRGECFVFDERESVDHCLEERRAKEGKNEDDRAQA